MNNEKIMTGDNNIDGKNVDQKPLFTISPSKIFSNLHNAAKLKALEEINDGSVNGKDVNKIIINTGMSSDGRYMDDSVRDKVDGNGKMKTSLFGFSTEYQIGIIFQVTKFPEMDKLPDDENQRKKELEKRTNEALKPIRQVALNGLNTYFKWFSGTDNAFKDTDLILFQPDSEGGKIELKNYRLPTILMKDLVGEIYRRIGDETDKNKENNKHRKDENNIPRIGFAVSYEITD